jgi:hypothetical protein
MSLLLSTFDQGGHYVECLNKWHVEEGASKQIFGTHFYNFVNVASRIKFFKKVLLYSGRCDVNEKGEGFDIMLIMYWILKEKRPQLCVRNQSDKSN